MEKLIINLIENFHIIMLIIVVLCFIIPMIYTLTKRKKRKVKRDILDKRTIMIDSGISSKIGLILFHLVFFAFGLIIIYVATNTAENLSTMIFGIIFGMAMCLIPIFISMKAIKNAIKVLNGKYIIILDELKDKYYYEDRSYNGDNIDHSGWRLYFKDYFKTYDKYVIFEDLKEGGNYKIGDKFYLVFLKGSNYPYMFAADEYNLAPSEKEKLKTIDETAEYIKLEKFVLETETQNQNVVINKKKIIKGFFDKSQKQTIIFSVFATLFALLFGIVIYKWYFNLIGLIVILFMFICFLLISIVKIKYLFGIINNIKNDNYTIKEDEVISLNNGMQYRDSNKMISFKFKNYKKIVYADKKYFTDVVIGDKLYLVFVKGEKEPIKVYNVKNSVIDSEVNNEKK